MISINAGTDAAGRQAYIADPDARTYRELAEAAESCQVAVIHPGQPRNSAEPDLDELLKGRRAVLIAVAVRRRSC